MLNYLWAGMMALGILWGAFHGNLAQVTNGALDSAREAVTLCLTMLGIMSFWCGILKVGEEAGLIEALTKKMRPVIRLLFPDMPEDHPAAAHILTNMIANMLGLGWAATPPAKGHGGTGSFGGGAEKAEKAGGLRKGNGQ